MTLPNTSPKRCSILVCGEVKTMRITPRLAFGEQNTRGVARSVGIERLAGSVSVPSGTDWTTLLTNNFTVLPRLIQISRSHSPFEQPHHTQPIKSRGASESKFQLPVALRQCCFASSTLQSIAITNRPSQSMPKPYVLIADCVGC